MKARRTKAGEGLLLHETREREELVVGDEGLIEAVGDHVEKHFGEVAMVYHEIISVYAHIDLYMVKPAKGRPVTTLVTCGMAQHPMANGKYAELALILPPGWPTPDDEGFDEARHYWPLRLLKELARFPHEYGTSLGLGHTIPNGNPQRPYAANTRLCGALIAPLIYTETDEAGTILHGDREISLWGVWTLYDEEMRFKLEHGAGALVDKLDEVSASEIVKIDRACAVPSRRRGLFRRT